MPQEENILQNAGTEESERLRGENARLAGEMKKLREAHEQQLIRLRTESAVREGLLRQGAHDPRTVLPLLQLDKIRLQDGRLCGLDEQLQSLKEESGYLFKDMQGPRIDSGFAHGRPPESGTPATLAGALAERYR